MPIYSAQAAGQAKAPDGKVVQISPASALTQRGPIVPVMVGLAESAAKPLLQKGESIASHGGFALIDTGATTSAIDDDLAQELKIPVIDQGKMFSATHEAHPCNIYSIQITVANQLRFQVLRATGVKLKKNGLVAIIGRDILQVCILNYSGPTGQFTLAL